MKLLSVSASGTAFSYLGALSSLAVMNESGIVPKFSHSSLKISSSDPAAVERSLPPLSEERLCVLSDHDISLPCFRALAKTHRGAGILIISADGSVPLIRELLESGIVERQNIVVFGMRTFLPDAKDFLERNHIRRFTAKEIFMNSLNFSADGMTEIVNSWPASFLALNLNILDPAFAPLGQEPGGFTSRELIYLLQRLRLMKDLKMICIKSEKELPVIPKLLIELG